jgi:hypothetical protein
MQKEQYRVNEATSQVYKYDPKASAYIFYGNLNGRTLKKFLDDKAKAEDEQN